MRRTNNDVQREWHRDRHSDFERLIQLIAGRHDHQDIDVAVGVRRAVGMRAEEDDLLRMEPLGDLAGEASDDRFGNIRAAIPAG